jgi:hypothetical protein
MALNGIKGVNTGGLWLEDIEDVVRLGANWMQLAGDSVRRWAVVRTVTEFLVSKSG